MAVTSKVYGLAQQSLAHKEIDFTGGAAKVMLCTSAYTPDQDAHRYRAQVSGEVVGAGYNAGGLTLANPTATYTAATNTLTLDCEDPSWQNASFTVRYAVFYLDSGSPATSPLLCWWDFGADTTSSNAPFSLFINSAGLLAMTAA